jgi:hypothetical protein
LISVTKGISNIILFNQTPQKVTQTTFLRKRNVSKRKFQKERVKKRMVEHSKIREEKNENGRERENLQLRLRLKSCCHS